MGATGPRECPDPPCTSAAYRHSPASQVFDEWSPPSSPVYADPAVGGAHSAGGAPLAAAAPSSPLPSGADGGAAERDQAEPGDAERRVKRPRSPTQTDDDKEVDERRASHRASSEAVLATEASRECTPPPPSSSVDACTRMTTSLVSEPHLPVFGSPHALVASTLGVTRAPLARMFRPYLRLLTSPAVSRVHPSSAASVVTTHVDSTAPINSPPCVHRAPVSAPFFSRRTATLAAPLTRTNSVFGAAS